MSTEKQAHSLPEVVGEETIISLQKAVVGSKKEARKGLDGFFKRREVPKGSTLYEVGSVPGAIYMLRGGAIQLQIVDGRAVKDMPVTTIYHAVPDTSVNRPLLGARYFFNRTPCTLAYVAQTPCTVYEITSGSLSDLHDADRHAVILMMYWLVACSDVSDIFVPIVSKALGLERIPAGDTQGLLRAVEEFREARNHPRMPEMLYKLYKSFMNRRIDRARELGIEASIMQPPPDRSV